MVTGMHFVSFILKAEVIKLMGTSLQINKCTQHRGTEMIVMTPNRFWCQGIMQIILSGKYKNLKVHYCHSLNKVAELLKMHPEIAFLLTDEYGDDENITDWLMFCSWARCVRPTLQVVMLRHADRPGVDISSHRQKQGYMDMMSPLVQIEARLNAIHRGCLPGTGIPSGGAVLTPRELYILKCLCHAESPVRLGKRLGIAVKTISTHKARALRKLGLKRLAPLLGRYQGLISVQEYFIFSEGADWEQ